MYDSVDASEDQRSYYRRSRHLIREIIRTHKRKGGTVLLSGHGGSIEAVSRGLRGFRHRHFGRAEHLIQQALRVDYCNFAILERDAHTREWIVRMPGSQNLRGAELSMQSIIPLYGLSTEHITQGTFAQLPITNHRSTRRHRRHRNR